MEGETTGGMDQEPLPQEGSVSPSVAAEFPGLGIAVIEIDTRLRRSPEPVRQRLQGISNRFFGAHAIHMRERPIPWAYRTFFRQIGLDPDRTRTPAEGLALERLHDGAFKSEGLPADALTIAIAETGVALCAFDAEQLTGKLGIRESEPRESLAGRPNELPHGTLVIADEKEPIALLFGSVADGKGVGGKTRRVAVAAVRVKGVPQIAIDEALWMVAATVDAA